MLPILKNATFKSVYFMLCNPAGYEGPLKDIPPEKFNSTAIPKSYHSPWDLALVREPALADTLVSCLSEPEPPADLPGYKSFNR